MQLALQLNTYTWDGSADALGPTLTEIAQAADEYGFSTLAVADHLWAVPPWMGPIEGPMPECYTTLAFLAASTRRIALMPLATPPCSPRSSPRSMSCRGARVARHRRG